MILFYWFFCLFDNIIFMTIVFIVIYLASPPCCSKLSWVFLDPTLFWLITLWWSIRFCLELHWLEINLREIDFCMEFSYSWIFISIYYIFAITFCYCCIIMQCLLYIDFVFIRTAEIFDLICPFYLWNFQIWRYVSYFLILTF